MSPKLALTILFIIAVIMTSIFTFLYLKKEGSQNKQTVINEEQQQEKQIIEQKVLERYEEISSKPQGETKEKYTQEELDFIANPEKEIKEELGMQKEESNIKPRFYTQEELDAIANPKN